jgi:hypothetical protein
MTPDRQESEVGVTRISGLESEPLEDLARRGLVRLPEKARSRRQARVKAACSVSDLVAEQRLKLNSVEMEFATRSTSFPS